MISSTFRLDGTPTVSLIWVNRVFLFMSPRRKGIGSQKQARFERLKLEILSFVGANPGCSAQSIVANLTSQYHLSVGGNGIFDITELLTGGIVAVLLPWVNAPGDPAIKGFNVAYTFVGV